MKQPGKDPRNVAISLRLSQTERDQLAQLTQHYKSTNPDLIVWLVQRELENLGLVPITEAGSSLEAAGTPSGTTLEQLEKRLEVLEKALRAGK